MEFNSINFMIFFPVVLALYFVIPKALRQIWSLAASYYFYMSWNARYAPLIAASTLITYVSGIAIERYRDSGRTGRRLTVLFSCLGINLGILLFFKYGNFLIASLDRGWSFCISALLIKDFISCFRWGSRSTPFRRLDIRLTFTGETSGRRRI